MTTTKTTWIDATKLAVLHDEHGFPTFNSERGRSFYQDESGKPKSPFGALAVSLATGYDIAEGSAIRVISVAKYAKLVGVKPAELKEQIRQNRLSFAAAIQDPESAARKAYFPGVKGDSVSFAMSGDSSEEIGDRETQAVTLSFATISAEIQRGASVDPEWIVISGQRRTFARPVAALLMSEMGIPSRLEYLISETTEKKLADIVRQQISDNRRLTSDIDSAGMVNQAVELMDNHSGISDAEVCRCLGIDPDTDVRAKQDLCYRAKLVRFDRALGGTLAQRIAMSPTKTFEPGGYVPVKKIRNTEVSYLLGLRRSEAAKSHLAMVVDVFGTDSAGRPAWQPRDTAANGKGSFGTRATIDQLEQFYSWLWKTGTSTNALNSSQLATIAEDTEVCQQSRPIGEVIEAILKGDSKFFTVANLVATK